MLISRYISEFGARGTTDGGRYRRYCGSFKYSTVSRRVFSPDAHFCAPWYFNATTLSRMSVVSFRQPAQPSKLALDIRASWHTDYEQRRCSRSPNHFADFEHDHHSLLHFQLIVVHAHRQHESSLGLAPGSRECRLCPLRRPCALSAVRARSASRYPCRRLEAVAIRRWFEDPAPPGRRQRKSLAGPPRSPCRNRSWARRRLFQVERVAHRQHESSLGLAPGSRECRLCPLRRPCALSAVRARSASRYPCRRLEAVAIGGGLKIQPRQAVVSANRSLVRRGRLAAIEAETRRVELSRHFPGASWRLGRVRALGRHSARRVESLRRFQGASSWRLGRVRALGRHRRGGLRCRDAFGRPLVALVESGSRAAVGVLSPGGQPRMLGFR